MTIFSQTFDKQRESRELRAARAASASASFGVYVGHDAGSWQFVPPELSVMILGPPRSGKTSSLIIPNVLAANGPVVSTSTKPDVLDATATARSRVGRCLLFDPTGSIPPTGDLEPLRWSPLQACENWDGAMTTARSLVQVAVSSGSRGMVRPESSHWNERAQSLLAPVLYAAALDGADMRTVLTWVDRRKSLPALTILAATPGGIADLAANALEGLAATDERELSGIWSTASGALSGFRTERALAVTVDPDFNPNHFAGSADTIYICAPAHRQAQVAPMVVGLVEDIRNAAYQRASCSTGEPPRPPVLLALDEVANIAPLPHLPSMISEGGGQGVVTLACLQDLSQARQRWPDEAEGFPSLFGCTVVLPGIGDVRTLEALSTLAGDEEIAARTVSTGREPSGHPVSDLVTGGRHHVGESATTQWRRRLPPDLIARGSPGLALAFDDRNQPSWIRLAPAHSVEPWKTLSESGRAHRRQLRRIEPDLHR